MLLPVLFHLKSIDMKTFEIWMEGYAATGESSPAHKIGEAEGETFEEACQNFRHPKTIISEFTGEVIITKGDPIGLDLNGEGVQRYERPSIWACRLYDNEQDARKHFG